MPAQDHEAKGQGRGDEKAHGPPEPSPEDRRDHDREGRETRALPIDDGLDHMAHEGFADQEQGHGHQRHGPAGIDGSGQEDGRQGCDERPDIGHEPHQRGEDAPQDRARHADGPEAQGRHDAEGGVQGELGQEVPAEPARSIVHGHRRPVEVARPEQANHPVAQIFPLHEDEDQDHEHDARRGQRLEHRKQDVPGHLHRCGLGFMDLDRKGAGVLRLLCRCRRRSRRRGRLAGRRLRNGPVEATAEIFQEARQLSERSLAQGPDLRFDRGLIARQVAGETRQLEADDGAEGDDDSKGDQHRDDDGRDASEAPPAQHLDEGRQHEREEDRHHDRQEDVLSHIERSQHHDPDGQGHEAGEAWDAGRFDLRLRGGRGVGARAHSRDLC